MQEQIQGLLQKIISDTYGIHLENISLDIPPKKNLGDFAFGAFPLAKELKKGPPVIASEIKMALDQSKNPLILKCEVAGPYLNIFIQRSKAGSLGYIQIHQESDYNAKVCQKAIYIDYIGANVGKPLGVGHMCTPTQGQAMIEAYKVAGYKVISDSHIGDWGIIFGKLICAYKKYGNTEELKKNAVDHLLDLYVKITAESERDDTLEETFREEFKQLSEGNPESIEYWEMFTSRSIKAMNQVLARLHVKPDFNIGESFYEGIGLPKIENYPDLQTNMHEVVSELIDLGIATRNDDNSVGVNFSEESELPSCILQKRNGTHGYLASDLASIKYRMQNWSLDKILYHVDVRQKLHFEQAFEIAKHAGWLKRDGKADTILFHAYNGFLSGKDGAFSTRKGNIIKLDLVLDEAESRAQKLILEKRQDLKEGDSKLQELGRMIGIGAIKYGYLKKKRVTDVIFDWDEFMTFEGNSGPYIQYAYVRASKLLRDHTIGEINFEDNSVYENALALDKLETLMIKIMDFRNTGGVLEECLSHDTPHTIAQYTYELTRDFNDFYDKVRIGSESDENMRNAFLYGVQEYSKNIETCFKILGIELPKEM